MNHLTPCNVLVTWFIVYSCIFVTQVTKSNKCKRRKPLSPNRNLEIINYWKSWSAVSRAWNRPNWIENEPMLRQLALFVLVCLCAVYYETISTLWFAFTPMTVTPFLRTFPNLRNRLFWMRLQCYQKLSFSVLIKGEQGTNTIKPMFTIKQNCVRCTPFAQWSLNLWCKNRKQRYIEHFWDISNHLRGDSLVTSGRYVMLREVALVYFALVMSMRVLKMLFVCALTCGCFETYHWIFFQGANQEWNNPWNCSRCNFLAFGRNPKSVFQLWRSCSSGIIASLQKIFIRWSPKTFHHKHLCDGGDRSEHLKHS